MTHLRKIRNIIKDKYDSCMELAVGAAEKYWKNKASSYADSIAVIDGTIRDASIREIMTAAYTGAIIFLKKGDTVTPLFKLMADTVSDYVCEPFTVNKITAITNLLSSHEKSVNMAAFLSDVLAQYKDLTGISVENVNADTPDGAYICYLGKRPYIGTLTLTPEKEARCRWEAEEYAETPGELFGGNVLKAAAELARLHNLPTGNYWVEYEFCLATPNAETSADYDEADYGSESKLFSFNKRDRLARWPMSNQEIRVCLETGRKSI